MNEWKKELNIMIIMELFGDLENGRKRIRKRKKGKGQGRRRRFG